MRQASNPPKDPVAQPFVLVREFDAPPALVWKAWTDVGHLGQWFGPKGITVTTAKLDLRPGGTFHSCRRLPDGREMWGKWVFREVAAPELLVWVHSFSDADGGLARHPFSPTWPLELLTEVSLAGRGAKTVLTLKWTPLNASAEEINTFNAGHPGMTHGWGGTFDQLTEFLNQQQTTKKQ